MRVGIERIHAYGGVACVGVMDVFRARQLNADRFANLMMIDKSVAMPWEDAVTNAVNAAKPLIDGLDAEERGQIEVVITATESGIDFGKSISTYVHRHLGLPQSCRLFEIKQACFAGTAALMMASGYTLAHSSRRVKALVIATDTARNGGRLSYAEPSQGTGAVAFLVGTEPGILELDWGASGMCSYEVMDTCRPEPGVETGDPDLSLFSYLDCLERCFEKYANRVEDVDVVSTFDALLFHTPFGGMVKGAHRKLMRQFSQLDRNAIEADFEARVMPSIRYPMLMGNVYSASIYLALLSLIENGRHDINRVGLFSYGSGCSSEFFSGTLGPRARQTATALGTTGARLAERVRLSVDDYDLLLNAGQAVTFGIRELSWEPARDPMFARAFSGRGLLALRGIENYHRIYDWS